MDRREALDAAAACVLSDRNKDYGSPERNFETTAAMMDAYLRGRGLLPASVRLESHDVAALMICLKLARLVTSPGKADTWVDIIGYASCGAEVATGAFEGQGTGN